MKKYYATEEDRIIAGIQSRCVHRTKMIAENEQHYGMLRAIAKRSPNPEEAREAGRNGKKLRKALNAIGKDQKLDKDTVKMLRRHSRQSRAVFKFASALDNATLGFNIAIRATL